MNAIAPMKRVTELTDQQRKFVDELVASGCTPTEAARRAGFAAPGQEAYRLMRKPHVFAAVRETRERLIAGHGCNLALKTLMEIMADATIPGSARVSACRVMLDAGGHFEKRDPFGQDTPIAQMTTAELENFIARASKIEAEGGAAPVIEVIDG